jgi:acetyl-CoA C-acetyltransferase
MVAFPYPKYLNAIIETDQAAALLMASAEAAQRLGVAPGRLVHWCGGGHAVEAPWFPTERPALSEAPALARAAGGALREAGVAVSDLAHFDLYSCFPVAVELACESLGIAEDDPRGLSVTGGLPYAGGPGNAYCLHSLAAMTGRVRERAGCGLVTGNGWYLTKHSASVVSSEPRRAATAGDFPEPALSAPVPFADEAAGEGVLETYTVMHGRSGAPERGVGVGRLSDGRRFLAELPSDRALLEDFEAREGVGRRGRLTHADERNRFEPL